MGEAKPLVDISGWTPDGYKAEASDNLRASNDAVASITSSSYTKLKSITVPKHYYSAILRVKFDMAEIPAGGPTAYGQVYKNGVAIGTEQSTTSGTYVTFSEDIDFGELNEGDTIELWAKDDAGNTAMVEHFRIYGRDIGLVVSSW